MTLGWQCFLVTILVSACWSDLTASRLPNWLSAIAFAGGLGLALATSPRAAATSLGACAFGASLPLLAHARGMLGAGDVKLFGALCTFLTPLSALVALGIGSLLGGAWVMLSLHAAFGATAQTPSHPLRVPYAPALCAGFAWVMWCGV